MAQTSLVSEEVIQGKIFLIRGCKVILDFDLATLYGVPTKSLNLAVKRNADRFPTDFRFRLTSREFDGLRKVLRFQFETSKSGRGGRRYLPYVFTEHGAIMVASVLNSPRAVQASIYVVRAFVRLRTVLAAHKELAGKLQELEKRTAKSEADIQAIVRAIRELMTSPEKPKRPIGFQVKKPTAHYHTRKKR